jgi:hypothetical protein
MTADIYTHRHSLPSLEVVLWTEAQGQLYLLPTHTEQKSLLAEEFQLFPEFGKSRKMPVMKVWC